MKSGLVTIALSAIWLISEIVLSFVRRAGRTDARQDKSSEAIIWFTVAISITAGVYLGLQPYGHAGGGSLAFPVAGIALMLCGIAIRATAIVTLKRQFTVDVAIVGQHHLITEGLYRYVRHPAYAGGLVSFLGLGLTFGSYLSTIVIFIPICAVFLYRISVEERVLVNHFGEEYLTYCASTKRLIPYVF